MMTIGVLSAALVALGAAAVWVRLWPRCVPRRRADASAPDGARGVRRGWPGPDRATLLLGAVMLLPVALGQSLLFAVFAVPAAAVAGLDLRRMVVPDAGCGLLALGAGIALSLGALPIDAASAVLGALAGGAVFAALAWGFGRLRGEAGLGEGDIVLMAALGLWVGVAALPVVWVVAAAIGLALAAWRRTRRLPFAPCLVLATWATLLAQQMALPGFGA